MQNAKTDQSSLFKREISTGFLFQRRVVRFFNAFYNERTIVRKYGTLEMAFDAHENRFHRYFERIRLFATVLIIQKNEGLGKEIRVQSTCKD